MDKWLVNRQSIHKTLTATYGTETMNININLDNKQAPSFINSTVITVTPQHEPSEIKPAKQMTLHPWTVNRSNDVEGRHSQDVCPFGTDFPTHDPQTTLRIIMQNTQYSLQLTHEDASTMQTIANIKSLGASMFTAISPNVN
jgi:hypothetical protein